MTFVDQNFQRRLATRLRIAVESDGKISNVSIKHPSGRTYAHGLLDQAAVASIWNCRFPAPQGGTRMLAIQEFEWALKDEPSDRLSPPK
jgi:outer membrane biosynthesis protein TonB